MVSDKNIKVGRRKTSTARVILKPGSGNVTINGKAGKDYFSTMNLYNEAISPLTLTDTFNSYDVIVNVRGGGFTGQVGAIKLGISRSLLDINEDFRIKLRKEGMLTRDPRMVERKKYGRPKARKRFQFSKR
jgi:small subunit ribosomal protein S9